MTNKQDDDAKLIAAAFHDEWSDGAPAAFARSAAAAARRRIRRRRVFSVVGATATVAVVMLLAFHGQTVDPTLTSSPHVTAATVSRGYEIISDEDLLAHLRDRPLLIVRKENGTREISLLSN